MRRGDETLPGFAHHFQPAAEPGAPTLLLRPGTLLAELIRFVPPAPRKHASAAATAS